MYLRFAIVRCAAAIKLNTIKRSKRWSNSVLYLGDFFHTFKILLVNAIVIEYVQG